MVCLLPDYPLCALTGVFKTKASESDMKRAFRDGDGDGDDTLSVREAVTAVEKLSGRSLEEDRIESACKSCGISTSREMECEFLFFCCTLGCALLVSMQVVVCRWGKHFDPWTPLAIFCLFCQISWHPTDETVIVDQFVQVIRHLESNKDL